MVKYKKSNDLCGKGEKKMKKRLLSMLLVICLLVSLLPAAMAAELDEEPAAEENAAEEVVETAEPAPVDEPIVPVNADDADVPEDAPTDAADEPIVPMNADDADAPKEEPAEAADDPVVPAAVETADELIAPAAADDADVPEDAPADAADEPETPMLNAEEAAEPAEASEGADEPKEPIVEENTGKREAPALIKAAEPVENAEEVEESAEDAAEEPVRVEFVCDPADAVVTVYDPAEKDENGENAVIEPESDGVYMLLPGDYLYDAECEGFERVEGVAFRVAAPEDGEALCIDVTLSPLPDRGTEKTRGITASGTCGAEGNNLTWTLSSSGVLTISGSGDMQDYYTTYQEGVPWYEVREYIESVIFADGVTHIGDTAFIYCSNLSSVTLPKGLISVGENAFSHCSALTGLLSFPEGTETIADNAFNSCTRLSGIDVPASMVTIGEYAFTGCGSIANVYYDGSPRRWDNCYKGSYLSDNHGFNSKVTFHFTWIEDGTCGDSLNWRLLVDKTLVIFGTGAMYDYRISTSYSEKDAPWKDLADDILHLVIQEGVTSIGKGAFMNCNLLQDAALPESLEKIETGAFFMLDNLKHINIPDKVSYMGNFALARCSSLVTAGPVGSGCDIELGWKTEIPASAFLSNSNLQQITIPDGVKKIGAYAIDSCTSLKKLVIPGSVTEFTSQSVVGCSLLQTAGPIGGGYDIEFGWTNAIPAYAFYKAVDLKAVVFPNSLTAIEHDAFSYCSSITQIVLPAKLSMIEMFAFDDCSALSQITFLGSAPTIEVLAFSGVTATATYPAGDASWTADVRQDYGGTITWKATLLPAPVLTEAFNSATGVRVSWMAVDGAAKYRLLRKNLTKGETSWTNVGETTDCTLIDKSAVSASRYTFTVECIDAQGNTISERDGTGRTCTYIAKADITELKAVANGVSITWSKPAGAKNFRVMRKKDGETKWNVIAVIEGTSYVDTTAKTGIKYWYTVRGVSMDNTVVINSYNGTGWSLNYAPAPTMTEAFNSSTGVRVSWKSVSNAAKYRLLRKNVTLGETQWQTVGETKDCTLIDKTAKSSNRYTYTVQCIDSNGRTSSAPNATGRTCTYIAMSKITSIGSVSNGIKLVWSQPAGAKNFRVMRKADGESKYTAIADVLGTSYIDKTAVKGVKYWYTIRAITLAGDMYINSYNSYGWSCTR